MDKMFKISQFLSVYWLKNSTIRKNTAMFTTA